MKYLRILISVFFIFIYSKNSFCQEKFKNNCIYVEALGNGVLGSINYERQLEKMPRMGLHLGVGFYFPGVRHFIQPIYNGGMNLLFKLKKENTFIDAGLGGTFTREQIGGGNESGVKKDEFAAFLIANVGYRIHTKNNFMWRVNLLGVSNKEGTHPWVGLAFGKRF